MCFVKVDMSWSSRSKKNYLHLAAERGLPKVLRLLLERARWQNTICLYFWEGWWKMITKSFRVQGVLEEKAEEADFTGYLPGASM